MSLVSVYIGSSLCEKQVFSIIRHSNAICSRIIMQNYLLYTFEILLVLVIPLLILYLKGNWPLRKIIPCLFIIPIIWYFAYSPIHELSHAAGIYLAGGKVIVWKLIPRFWMGEFAQAWVKASGITQNWQQIMMTGFPYLIDLICLKISILVFRKSNTRNPLWLGMAFMMLCLRPAMDFIFEPIAYFTGDKNDFYALQQIMGTIGIRTFVIASMGFAGYTIVSSLKQLISNSKSENVPTI